MTKRKIPYEIIHLVQGTHEWKEWRKKGFGASDASRVLSKQAQARSTLIHEKIYGVRDYQSSAMRRGKELEEEAREIYCEEVGIEVTPVCIQCIKSPWIRASLDGMSADGRRIVEIKCGKKNYEEISDTGEVPQRHYGQLQHLMMATGLNNIDYWAYDPDDDGILIEVQRDRTYISNLRVKLRQANVRLNKQRQIAEISRDLHKLSEPCPVVNEQAREYHNANGSNENNSGDEWFSGWGWILILIVIGLIAID